MNSDDRCSSLILAQIIEIGDISISHSVIKNKDFLGSQTLVKEGLNLLVVLFLDLFFIIKIFDLGRVVSELEANRFKMRLDLHFSGIVHVNFVESVFVSHISFVRLTNVSSYGFAFHKLLVVEFYFLFYEVILTC